MRGPMSNAVRFVVISILSQAKRPHMRNTIFRPHFALRLPGVNERKKNIKTRSVWINPGYKGAISFCSHTIYPIFELPLFLTLPSPPLLLII